MIFILIKTNRKKRIGQISTLGYLTDFLKMLLKQMLPENAWSD
jgi:hypothetical protein